MTRRLETPEEAQARLAGETLTERERAELWQRVSASTERAPRQRAVRIVLLGAVPALAAAAWLLLALRPAAPVPQPVADACALDAGARELSLPASCGVRALQVEGDEWQLAAGSRVDRIEQGARVQSGRVRFSVRKRAQGRFRVQVSQGEVQVIGTVFAVEEHGGRGSVSVSEGVIEFVWKDGARERVSAGQTLHWPRRTPVPPPEAARAQDAGAGRTQADLDQVLERLLQLKSQKRFAEATLLLRRTLSERGLGARQRERISYELGLALEADGQESCAHWRRHVERFGTGTHAAALRGKIEGCRR